MSPSSSPAQLRDRRQVAVAEPAQPSLQAPYGCGHAAGDEQAEAEDHDQCRARPLPTSVRCARRPAVGAARAVGIAVGGDCPHRRLQGPEPFEVRGKSGIGPTGRRGLSRPGRRCGRCQVGLECRPGGRRVCAAARLVGPSGRRSRAASRGTSRRARSTAFGCSATPAASSRAAPPARRPAARRASCRRSGGSEHLAVECARRPTSRSSDAVLLPVTETARTASTPTATGSSTRVRTPRSARLQRLAVCSSWTLSPCQVRLSEAARARHRRPPGGRDHPSGDRRVTPSPWAPRAQCRRHSTCSGRPARTAHRRPRAVSPSTTCWPPSATTPSTRRA